MTTTLLAFLGACLLVAASPGPSTVLIIRQSLHSRRAGFMTVLGNETGVFIWGVVAAFGLTALLTASEVAYGVIRIVGAVVLVGFGVQAFRSARRAGREAEPPAGAAAAPERRAQRPWRSYRAGLLLNLANPKAAVFAISFLPQFVPAGTAQLPAMVMLAAVWAVFEIGYYGTYVWFVGRIRGLVERATVRQWLERVSGGVLITLGVRMALDG
jgi:threonine/homoserine/homoserine lactone efflux protein